MLPRNLQETFSKFILKIRFQFPSATFECHPKVFQNFQEICFFFQKYFNRFHSHLQKQSNSTKIFKKIFKTGCRTEIRLIFFQELRFFSKDFSRNVHYKSSVNKPAVKRFENLEKIANCINSLQI